MIEINRTPKRLVKSPIFLLSCIRSGSTLLRCILNSHTKMHAGHELHLPGINVHLEGNPTASAMQALGMSEQELEHILWDRVLHDQLERSGKQIIVDKTPQNIYHWQRIHTCWPEARYIFLLRHPLNIIESIEDALQNDGKNKGHDRTNGIDRTQLARDLTNFAETMSHAYKELHGIKVKYEDVVNHPHSTTQSICRFLDIPWEEGMLEYGDSDHGRFEFHLGDWGDKIKSGTIQPLRNLPDEHSIPKELVQACKLLGYC